VAVGDRTTLKQLFSYLRDALDNDGISSETQLTYRDFRTGDVRHSQADIAKAQRLLGYAPTHRIQDGVGVVMPWYIRNK
jgi:UDP-N-acetylglucosamine 4-epimerase